MISPEKMREWLEKLKRPYEEEIWGRPFEKSCHHDLEIIDAILAELEGPSEEERKELIECLNSIFFYDELPEIHRKGYEKIRNLIEGTPAPETGIKLDPQTEEELRQSDAADKFYDEIMGTPAPGEEER